MTAEQQAAVEKQWLDRAKARDLKPKSMAYRKAEVEFFTGAMATLQALFPNQKPDRLSSEVPPIWLVNALSGRPIVERS